MIVYEKNFLCYELINVNGDTSLNKQTLKRFMLKHIDKCEEKFNSPGERFVYVGYFRKLLLVIISFTDYLIFMNKCLQHMIIDDKTYAYLK